MSSNETTEESAPGSQSQSSGPYMPPTIRSHKALERTASDELPAPALSAPPATIPLTLEGSQASQFDGAFTQEMSIQASQDAPSPLPSSQVSFLEIPPSPSPSKAGKRKRDVHDDYGDQDSEDDEGEMEANSSFDIERALLGSAATPFSQSRHYTNPNGVIGQQSASKQHSTILTAVTASALDEEADLEAENMEGLAAGPATQPFGFHFSQIPGAQITVDEEQEDEARMAAAEEDPSQATADIAATAADSAQTEPSAFRLHFSQLYPDLDSLRG